MSLPLNAGLSDGDQDTYQIMWMKAASIDWDLKLKIERKEKLSYLKP